MDAVDGYHAGCDDLSSSLEWALCAESQHRPIVSHADSDGLRQWLNSSHLDLPLVSLMRCSHTIHDWELPRIAQANDNGWTGRPRLDSEPAAR